jgi:hypothetical protein
MQRRYVWRAPRVRNLLDSLYRDCPSGAILVLSRSMHAISIKQPFVEQILIGKKRREFRSRRTLITGRIYLYASLKDLTDRSEWTRAKASRDDKRIRRSVIVGTVEIVRCDKHGTGYAYVLRNPTRFKRTLKPTNQPQPCLWTPRF